LEWLQNPERYHSLLILESTFDPAGVGGWPLLAVWLFTLHPAGVKAETHSICNLGLMIDDFGLRIADFGRMNCRADSGGERSLQWARCSARRDQRVSTL
jgi:hypothetical protein